MTNAPLKDPSFRLTGSTVTLKPGGHDFGIAKIIQVTLSLCQFYFQVADVQIRSELDFTIVEAKSAMYEEAEADTLAALAYGKIDGIFTTGLEFGDSFKYFTETVKLQGSQTIKSKGLLTLIEQVKNWQFVTGAKR